MSFPDAGQPHVVPGGHPPYPVDVDPESAGLVRREAIGFALPLAVLGTLMMLGSLALDWVETNRFVVYGSGQDGPLDDRGEYAGLFDARDVVEDVVGVVPRFHDAGALAGAFFPWGALVVTVVACGLAALASVGLRRRTRTTVARTAAVVAVTATLGFGMIALLDLGWVLDTTGGPDTSAPSSTGAAPESGGRAEPEFLEAEVQPAVGAYTWFGGALLLWIAGALGPRVGYRLPSGAAVGGPGAPGFPAHLAAPGGPGAPPGPAGWPVPYGRGPLVRSTTQPVAVVLAALAAVLCLAGYGFLPWATDVTFADISDATREYGGGDDPVAEAYFGWLGWALLLGSGVVAVLVALGRRGRSVSPRAVRPFLVLVMAGGLLVHLVAVVDVDTLDVGLLATSAGLAASLLGALLPLRTTAVVTIAPTPYPPTTPSPPPPPPPPPPPAR
ncbi:hypothetical protein FE634_14740 [Nocardioides dongxiaopingii]|uniref:hypothetical protein n=1 Tax=Nocardioides sp. S-1144 TaxID=2582905 RepID=UPI001165854A|nr:hypothetical protein [Nocardioides sp. S-1144]QCW51350.2 hypothetical protein FE634_14740 [Nocardioides sp. S-1144]